MFRLLLLVILAAASAVVAAPPDVRTGNVNGIAGLLYWPANLASRSWGNTDPLPSAEGCEVHLVPWSNPDRELRYPCGTWFVPPFADRFNFWLESDERITPTLSMVVFAPKPFAGSGLAAMVPLTPAGRIAIPPNRAVPPSESFRLLSIEAKDSWLRTGARVFDRRVVSEQARTAVQMPVGRVIAGRFDRATNNAIALSRPLEIKEGTLTRVWPVPPRESDLLVVLSKMPELQLSKSIEASLTLDDGITKKNPDVLVSGFERIIAIWYGITSSAATVTLESNVAQYTPQQVHFTRGKVATVRAILTKK
jgi:hypothetical protein